MSESKFKITVRSAWIKVKENIGPIVACIIPGIIIGGSVTALHDSRRLTNLERKFQKHEARDDLNIDIANNIIHKTNDRLDELVRQNNLLMEKALQETEGKAS